ncbi:MAG: tRNA pseudouridine(55) synthase TruB, partial [Stackebrandtia sp.]
TISRLDVVEVRRGEHLDVDVTVDCSSGTYIRAIARDLGVALGVGGHLVALRRTRVGGFTAGEAHGLDDLAERESPITHSVRETVRRLMPCREVDAADAAKFGNGGKLAAVGMAGPYAVVGPDSAVIGVAIERDDVARPDMVLAPDSRR